MTRLAFFTFSVFRHSEKTSFSFLPLVLCWKQLSSLLRGLYDECTSGLHRTHLIQAFFEANFPNYMKWRLLMLFVYRQGLAQEFTQLNMPIEYSFILCSQSCVELLKQSSGLQNREVVGKTLDATCAN